MERSQRVGRRWPWWWTILSSWGRISFVGLGAAGLLAIGLGIYIPAQVQRHMLQAQTDSNEQVLEALLGSRTLPLEDPESGFEQLDRFVASAILRGDFVRVKLWSPDGQILYSDDRRLVGQTFPPSAEIEGALAGEPRSELSDLSAPENRLERGLANHLLEFYLPVEQGGRVVAVWEVYQSLDLFEERLSRVRLSVWVSVVSGLAVLLLFLVSSFWSLLAIVQQRRREAEARSRDLAALLEVSRSAGSTLDPETLSEAAVGTIQGGGRYGTVGLIRRQPDEDGLRILAISADASCPRECIEEIGNGGQPRPPGCSSLAVELEGGGGETLALIACRPNSLGFSPEDRALLETAGEHIRIALENAGLYEGLRFAERRQRKLMRRLVTAHEDERRWIVGEIHDGLGQNLHRILYGLRGCRSGSPEETADELERLEAIVAVSVHQLRRLLQELRPPSLEDVGLGAALRGLVDTLAGDGLEVELQVSDRAGPELPLAVRESVFRITQEALANVLKHSASRRALAKIVVTHREVELRVADEGRGIPAGPQEGLGLWLMQERAEAVGGKLSIHSDVAGTTVTAVIPLGAET